MITFWSIISGLCRMIGLYEWSSEFWEHHEAKVHAQEIANAPKTKSELMDDISGHNL